MYNSMCEKIHIFYLHTTWFQQHHVPMVVKFIAVNRFTVNAFKLVMFYLMMAWL